MRPAIFIMHVSFSDYPNIDLKDILDGFDPQKIKNLSWGLENIWWIGESMPDDLPTEEKFLLSGETLLDIAQAVNQTLSGTFCGYTSEQEAAEFLIKDWKGKLDKTLAQVMLELIENIGFDIYVREQAEVEAFFKHFEKASIQNPKDYLYKVEA